MIGLGGLGHMAVKLASACGCEVTAFTSTREKMADARTMGGHHVHDSRDADAVSEIGESFDLLLSTVNAPLDWNADLGTVRRRAACTCWEPCPPRWRSSTPS